jgi:hypothetical protein
MQPFCDVDYDIFELLGDIEVSWVPSPRHWQLNPASYSFTDFDETVYDILCCPICVGIAPLGVFYECTHECCVRCDERSVQNTCAQCRKPRRTGIQTKNQKENCERIFQFNKVINDLSFQCPCTKCKPIHYTNTEMIVCPRRFVCPLLGTRGCTFTGSEAGIREHLIAYHPIQNLWDDYRASVLTKRVRENILSVWCEMDELVAALCSQTGPNLYG